MHAKEMAKKQEDPSPPEAQQSHSLPYGQRDKVGCQAPLWLSKHTKGGRDVTTVAEDEKTVSWEHHLCVFNAKRWF